MKKALVFILALTIFLGALCSCGADSADVAGVYKIEKNLYYATLVDKAYNSDDSFTIEEKDGKTVFITNHIGISGEKISDEIGELKSFSPKKSNFDEIIFGESWQDGASAESLRKNNKASWKAEKKGEETFYVMLQNDGTVLLASVKTKSGGAYCAYIRKISK